MSNKKTYLVTERAGAWVAGQRRPADGRLRLTDRQAAYELALGTIKPFVPDARKASRQRRPRAQKG